MTRTHKEEIRRINDKKYIQKREEGKRIPNQRIPFDPHIAGQQADTWRAATDLTNRHQCVPLTPSENNPDVHCSVQSGRISRDPDLAIWNLAELGYELGSLDLASCQLQISESTSQLYDTPLKAIYYGSRSTTPTLPYISYVASSLGHQALESQKKPPRQKTEAIEARKATQASRTNSSHPPINTQVMRGGRVESLGNY